MLDSTSLQKYTYNLEKLIKEGEQLLNENLQNSEHEKVERYINDLKIRLFKAKIDELFRLYD